MEQSVLFIKVSELVLQKRKTTGYAETYILSLFDHIYYINETN